MPGESGQVIVRNVVPKVVQQQEGIEVGRIPEPKGASQMYASTLDCGF
jgi:hypothetical protein